MAIPASLPLAEHRAQPPDHADTEPRPMPAKSDRSAFAGFGDADAALANVEVDATDPLTSLESKVRHGGDSTTLASMTRRTPATAPTGGDWPRGTMPARPPVARASLRLHAATPGR